MAAYDMGVARALFPQREMIFDEESPDHKSEGPLRGPSDVQLTKATPN